MHLSAIGSKITLGSPSYNEGPRLLNGLDPLPLDPILDLLYYICIWVSFVYIHTTLGFSLLAIENSQLRFFLWPHFMTASVSLLFCGCLLLLLLSVVY